MKKYMLFGFLALISFQAYSQENNVTISGGYSFATIDGLKGTGWRINGSYEFIPTGGSFAHGISAGVIHLSATDDSGAGQVKRTVNSWPIYYAPKYMFGNEKIKGFVKGAVGIQYAGLKREGLVSFEDTDFGFYGGAAAGLRFFLTEMIFINAEYEIAWASNTWYDDGWINSVSGGIGIQF